MSLYSKIIDIQKLQAAWRNVKKNKPARGVDDVTWEMFDNNIREELKQLNLELKNHEYHPFPVRMVNMYKEEKIRKIALFSMRDKVVQQATAQELTRIYDADFSGKYLCLPTRKIGIVSGKNNRGYGRKRRISMGCKTRCPTLF